MPTEPRLDPLEAQIRQALATVADTIDPVPDWDGVLALDLDRTAGPGSARTPDGGRRDAASSPRILAAAVAAVVVLLIASLALLTQDRDHDDVRSGPPTTADRTPTTVVAPARVGAQITVDADALPVGVVYLGENPAPSGVVEARFGLPGTDRTDPRPTGPALWITAYATTPSDETLLDRVRAAYPDATFSEVQGHPAFTTTAAATEQDAAWTTLTWESNPTLSIAVSTVGVSDADRARVAESVRFHKAPAPPTGPRSRTVEGALLGVGFDGVLNHGVATIGEARTAAELADRWAATGLPAEARPDVDLHQYAVVFIAIGVDGCPPDGFRFTAVDRLVTAEPVEPATCTDPLAAPAPRTYVYAFDRERLSVPFTLEVQPASDAGDLTTKAEITGS